MFSVYYIYIHSICIVYIIYLQYLICQKQSDKIAIRGLVLVRVEHESQTQQTWQVSSWWQLPTGTISSICHQLSSSRCSSGMVGLALPRLANTELRDLVGGLVSSTLGDVGAWTSEVQGVLDLLKMGFVMLRLFLPYLGENVANTQNICWVFVARTEQLHRKWLRWLRSTFLGWSQRPSTNPRLPVFTKDNPRYKETGRWALSIRIRTSTCGCYTANGIRIMFSGWLIHSPIVGGLVLF